MAREYPGAILLSSSFWRFAGGGLAGVDREDREEDGIPKRVREEALLLERVFMGWGAPKFPGLVWGESATGTKAGEGGGGIA